MEINKIIGLHLGFIGRIISTSKSAYVTQHPNHAVIFNANLVIEKNGSAKKVWFGDIDLTEDERAIVGIANDIGCKVYVLREMDARFGEEENPKIEKAVYYTDGFNKWIINYYQRDDSGRIVKGSA